MASLPRCAHELGHLGSALDLRVRPLLSFCPFLLQEMEVDALGSSAPFRCPMSYAPRALSPRKSWLLAYVPTGLARLGECRHELRSTFHVPSAAAPRHLLSSRAGLEG